MLTRVFVLGFALLMAVPASATVEQCQTSTEILKLQEGLLANARISSLRVKLVDCLRALRGAQLDADALADSAGDKSKVPSKGSDKTLDGRVKLLESLAKEDYQRLLETEDLLRKTQANGVDETKALAEVQKSRTTLETVVRLVDGKPDLVPNLFIAHRSDQEASDSKTKAKATEDAAELACSSEEGTNGQVLTPKLTDLAGVQRCVDVLTGLLNANAIALGSVGADSSDAPALKDRSNALTAKLDYVRERGIAIWKEKQKTAADLQGKIDAEKDDAKKKPLQADLKVVQDDIAVLNAIAVEPGLPRRCLRYSSVSSADLNDAAGVERCVNTLTDAIADAKIAVASPDVKAATDRVKSLEAFNGCIASMKQGKAASCDVPPAVRPTCGVVLVVSDTDHLGACGESMKCALADAEKDLFKRTSESNAALKLQKELEHRLHDVQAAGDGLSVRKTRDLARLDKAISDETDPVKKKDLVEQRAKVKAEIVLLAVIAVDPAAETKCGDENAHLDIDSAIYVTRCIHFLKTKVREARVDTGPDHHKNLVKSELQLARFEEAGRRMATLAKEQLEVIKAKHDAAGASADDKSKADDDQKTVQADLDRLAKVVIIPGDDPQAEFADYEQWFTKFSGGYEYVGANDAFAKGFPRIGATIGFHYSRNAVPEDSANWHPLSYGFYELFTVALTNSGEAKPTPLPSAFQASTTSTKIPRALDDDTAPVTPPAPDNQLKRALEFEFQTFHPLWRNDYQVEHPRLRTRIGPILVVGGRKLDSDSFLHSRIYIGMRNARSAETYWDVLYGKTGGLVSRRVEVRGQYALPHQFKSGGRLAIGALGNFGANKRKLITCEEGAPHCREEEKDIVKFYISYDIDGPGLLSFFGLDQKPKTTP